MNKSITVVKREAVFIPIKAIGPEIRDRIKQKLDFKFYDDKMCKSCEWLSERHCDICSTCPGFKAGYNLAPTVTVKNNKYLKVPVGSYNQIVNLLELKGFDVTVRDKSPKRPIRPIKFTGKFREGQRDACVSMAKKRRGVMKAPPRSGKTVSGTAVICKLGRKTLIMAGQREWLNGFIETFIGSKTQPALTDLNPKRIKLCKTLEDFETHDICLCTPNIFHSEKGSAMLPKLRDMFEVMFIDEVHMGAADKYIQILAKFNVRWMIGLSGTPSRKDAKYVLVRHVVGPILHEVKVESLRPHVKTVITKYRKDYKGNTQWARMISSLENDKGRILQIAKEAIKDVKAGHLVMIPYAQMKPCLETIKKINELAGRDLAYPYHGKTPKKILDRTLERARKYHVRCLVGTAKKLSVGLNIPRASMLYEVTMSSNKENAEQRMRRVTTKMKLEDEHPKFKKPDPCIKFFLDDTNVRRSCLKNEFFNVVKPKLQAQVDDRTQVILDTYFKAKTGQSGGGGGRFEL
jgi:superfamily II DNA or RNA helicase